MFTEAGRGTRRLDVGGEGQAGEGDEAVCHGYVLKEAPVFKLPGFEEVGDGAERADGHAVLR